MAQQFLLVLGFCLTVTQAAVLSFWQESSPDIADSSRATLNRDSRYDRWLDAKRVLYRFDPISYSGEEKSLIMTAMSQIAADMNKCISFQEYNADTDGGLDNIYISKTLNDGTIPATCFTFYGRLLRAAGQGQKMAIHDGPNGCMDNVREVMKILTNVLGLRNEYNRPDRDQHLKIFVEDLQPELRFSNLLNAYNASQVLRSGPFDYNSITIPRPSQYAIAGKHIFEFPADKAVPTLAHLSKADCVGLSFMYGCDDSKCVDFYPEAKPVQTSTEAATTIAEISAATTEAATTPAATEAVTEVATEAATQAVTEAATTVEVTTKASSVSTTEEEKLNKIAVVADVETKMVEATSAVAQPANLVAETSALTSEASTEVSTEASTIEAATTVEVATEASSTEAATSSAPTLNVTLMEIIIPKKSAEEVKDQAAVVIIISAATEAPSVVDTTETSVATTEAAKVEETTASNPSLKFVVIAAMPTSSEAPVAVVSSEETTVAATSEAAPTEAATTAAAVVTAAEVTTEAATSEASSAAVESTTAAVRTASLVV